MAQLPSAFSCHAARASCTLAPVFCTAKSTMVVTPPHAAAVVPVSNVSLRLGAAERHLHVGVHVDAARHDVLAGGVDGAVGGDAEGVGLAGRQHGGDRLAVDQHVGRAAARSALTTVPPVISVVRHRLDQLVVGVGAAVAVERPAVADQLDLVHVEVADDQLGLVGVADVADELALRVDEVALAVEVVVADLGLDADPVDRPDVVHVGDRRGRLLDAPDVLAQAAVGGRRVEHDLGAVQAERPPALGEVAVVADVHADLADGRLEDRVPAVAGPEVELLPEPLDLRDVLLAELAEVGPVGVDDGRGVVVQAGLLDLVHRQHEHHPELLGHGLEALRRRAVGDRFGVVVVLRLLHLAEVRAVEQLLEAHHLSAVGGRLAGGLLVLVDHRLLGPGPVGLQQRCADGVHHPADRTLVRLSVFGPGQHPRRMWTQLSSVPSATSPRPSTASSAPSS